ncbi:unnamed protein product [Trichobilharzia regenti]|nr:unnamed protein product [Trichobilharzia regenti]
MFIQSDIVLYALRKSTLFSYCLLFQDSVDTSSLDSCCDDSRFINTNNNKTVQIHVDSKNVSSDSATLNYYNHDDSMDNTYKSTLVTNMNSSYNNHIDDSKTVNAQFDYINNDQKSTSAKCKLVMVSLYAYTN